MEPENCWEKKKCERGPNGEKVKELGLCPAAADDAASGINRGDKGGRICWAIAGTLCGENPQGTFAQKEKSCMECEFFLQVMAEEGARKFQLLKPGQVYAPYEKEKKTKKK